MNMNQQRSMKIKKLRYFGICNYTQIEKSVAVNNPDIVIKDHKNKTCKLIDMAEYHQTETPH